MDVPRKPVHVRWIDSGGHRGWNDPADLNLKPMECESLGWLVHEGKDAVTVALNRVADGSSCAPFGELMTIPRVAIKRMRRVKL